MSVGSADLHKAIRAAWTASGLDHTFRLYLPAGTDLNAAPILNDQEAAPGQPFPFCVIEDVLGKVAARMSGTATAQQQIHDYTVKFVVHATAGGDLSAKELAAWLAEEIMKHFGGHPTVKAIQEITLDNGSHVITQYQGDVGLREGDEEYSWTVNYLFRLDVPVAV